MCNTNQLRNIHPRDVPRGEFLISLGVTQYRLAKGSAMGEAIEDYTRHGESFSFATKSG